VHGTGAWLGDELVMILAYFWYLIKC